MFERFSEKARRVVFFARDEAREYGSPNIETEHLLLGLLREDKVLASIFLGQGDVLAQIRMELEQHITRGERISTPVEVPLTSDSRRVLKLAAEESERLGQQDIGTEHILLGLLGVEGALAAQLLQARGLKATEVRARPTFRVRSVSNFRERQDDKAKLTIDSFLAGLKWFKGEELIDFFAQSAQVIDVFGKRWNREEIFKGCDTLFAPYAKKNVVALIEATLADTNGLFLAIVVWKNAILASQERVWTSRMSIVMIRGDDDDWRILLMQVTPVQPGAQRIGGLS